MAWHPPYPPTSYLTLYSRSINPRTTEYVNPGSRFTRPPFWRWAESESVGWVEPVWSRCKFFFEGPRPRLIGKDACPDFPIVCNKRGNGKPFFGIFNGRRQDAVHRNGSQFLVLVELKPSAYAARHRNRKRTIRRIFLSPCFLNSFCIYLKLSPCGAVPRALIPYSLWSLADYTMANRSPRWSAPLRPGPHQPQWRHQRHYHLFKYLQSHLCSQRLTGSNHVMPGNNLRSHRKCFTGYPILRPEIAGNKNEKNSPKSCD